MEPKPGAHDEVISSSNHEATWTRDFFPLYALVAAQLTTDPEIAYLL